MGSRLLRWFLPVLALLSAGTQADEQTTVLVMGATGRQGSAVVEELLSRGYPVRAMTRKPDGKKARKLDRPGVEIVQGDYADPESLRAAMRGVSQAFFYSGFSRNELREGRNVIEAARTTGLEQLVYSSGAAADPETGMSDAVKAQVEMALRESGVPYTVFRPVAFMENYRGQQKRIIADGVVDSRAPERIAYFIAIADIGFFVGEAIQHPDEWLGRAENIASDKMTFTELAATFSRVTGQDIPYVRKPLEEYLQSFPPPLRPLFRWYDEVGYEADVEAWRRQYPNLMTLEQYLRDTGWEN